MKKSSGYWTYERCKEEVSKYKSTIELRKNNGSVLNSIKKNKWLDLLERLETGRVSNNSYEQCKKIALECKTKKELKIKYNKVYNKIYKYKWYELFENLNNSRKKSGYWTYEKCKEEALKYKTPQEFIDENESVYNKIHTNKWYELLKHLKYKTKPNGYWTYEKCKEESLKCENRNELKETCKSAYYNIYKNKWFELFDHIEEKVKPAGYWTHEKCKEVTLKYKTIKELSKNNGTVYCKIIENKWTELIEHLEKLKKPDGYWTYNRCKKEALKYKYKTDFFKNSVMAYRTTLKNNWNDLFDHMEPLGNRVKRLIYVYEFPDNHCYIGLTGNMNRRNNQHYGQEKNHNSSVFKYMKKTNLIPKLILKTDYIDVNDAILLEEKILNEYKNNGWITLNVTKTGNIGSNNVKCTYEKCKEESKKYKSISEFMRNASSLYESSRKNNWLDDFFVRRKSKNGYWNDKELCREEAKKYKNRSEFCYGSWSAYNYSNINNWLDEFFTKKLT